MMPLQNIFAQRMGMARPGAQVQSPQQVMPGQMPVQLPARGVPTMQPQPQQPMQMQQPIQQPQNNLRRLMAY